MAPVAIYTSSHLSEKAFQTAALELKYEHSTHLVDLITKDEAIRKLRFEVHVLEDDNLELRELFAQEEDRSDAVERLANEHLGRAEVAEAALRNAENELQDRVQELSTLKAEAKSLRNVSTDASKTLSEKLELTRELSALKPELEHLRSQAAANQEVLSEKLLLQRQLSELQIELEHSKQEARRALAKRRNTQHDIAQEDEIEMLRKSMQREKRLREKAEETLEQLQSQVDEETKIAQRTVVKETRKVEEVAQAEVRMEELSRSLALEQKEKNKAERALQMAQSASEAKMAVLEDKLNQFRNKLRTTKEQLKNSEIALADARALATAAPKNAKNTADGNADKPAGKPTKRKAAQMGVDASTLGTPGDGGANKRSRKQAVVGDKSTFSITPFLNRTMSVAPDSPAEAEVGTAQPESSPSTTTAMPTTESASQKKQPLAPVSASKSNIIKKAPAKKKVTLGGLEKVIEEDEGSQPKEVVAKPTSKPTTKPSMRKSLAAFATFNLEPEPEKKKKRKLGGLGKTLFDEDDDAPKALPGRGLFGGVKLGPLAGLGGAKGSILGGGKRKGLMATDDGFQFSPLKKERKMMSFVK